MELDRVLNWALRCCKEARTGVREIWQR
jgi:hypothetical protein